MPIYQVQKISLGGTIFAFVLFVAIYAMMVVYREKLKKLYTETQDEKILKEYKMWKIISKLTPAVIIILVMVYFYAQ